MNRPTRRPLHAPALLLLALAALLAASRAAAAETYWLDGYEVEVSLHPLRSSFVAGEPVVVTLEFENHSGTDLELLVSGENGPGWPDDFEVRVEGPDGELLPRPEPEERSRDRGYTNSFVNAVRGHVVTGRMGLRIDLSNWAKIERPGVYTVTVRRGVRAGPRARRYRIFPGTTKPAVEVRARTEVTVTEGGPERTGRLVEELAASMLACDQSASVDAAGRLAALKDERVVPHLVKAVAGCRNPSVRYTALAALAQFKTDAAFQGLRQAARDADEDFRTVVAHLLGGLKRPEARALLISMRRDPYYGVRLMVLDALEGLDTEEARRLIWEMTNDEHPRVRDEALRFIQERSAHPPRR